MNIQPITNKIVFRQTIAEKVTESGFILSASEVLNPNTGVVVAVGPGRVVESGELVPLAVKPGDTIAYHPRGSINPITVDGEMLFVIGEEDVLAVIG